MAKKVLPTKSISYGVLTLTYGRCKRNFQFGKRFYRFDPATTAWNGFLATVPRKDGFTMLEPLWFPGVWCAVVFRGLLFTAFKETRAVR